MNAFYEKAVEHADESARLLREAVGYVEQTVETDTVIVAAANAHATLALAYAQLSRG